MLWKFLALVSSRLAFVSKASCARASSQLRQCYARQRSLRATLAWSYDLLSPSEQALFRRLSAFVGGATLEAVEGARLLEGLLAGLAPHKREAFILVELEQMTVQEASQALDVNGGEVFH